MQAMAGLDDSYEFFGGGLVGDHLVSYESGDDHFDMSEGFRGKLQYLIAMQSTQLTPRTGSGSLATDPKASRATAAMAAGAILVELHAAHDPSDRELHARRYGQCGHGRRLRRNRMSRAGAPAAITLTASSLGTRAPASASGTRTPTTIAHSAQRGRNDTADLAVKNVSLHRERRDLPGPERHRLRLLDLAGNALVDGSATTASLFTAFPATISERDGVGVRLDPGEQRADHRRRPNDVHRQARDRRRDDGCRNGVPWRRRPRARSGGRAGPSDTRN